MKREPRVRSRSQRLSESQPTPPAGVSRAGSRKTCIITRCPGRKGNIYGHKCVKCKGAVHMRCVFDLVGLKPKDPDETFCDKCAPTKPKSGRKNSAKTDFRKTVSKKLDFSKEESGSDTKSADIQSPPVKKHKGVKAMESSSINKDDNDSPPRKKLKTSASSAVGADDEDEIQPEIRPVVHVPLPPTPTRSSRKTVSVSPDNRFQVGREEGEEDEEEEGGGAEEQEEIEGGGEAEEEADEAEEAEEAEEDEEEENEERGSGDDDGEDIEEHEVDGEGERNDGRVQEGRGNKHFSNNAKRTSPTTCVVTSKRRYVTAVKCPCEFSKCSKLVQVGRYGRLATSTSAACVHCGRIEKGGFNGVAQLKQHLLTNNKFRRIRGFKVITHRNACGGHTQYYVNNPKFDVRKKTKNALVRMFKCPICHDEMNYDHRWKHVRTCFPKHKNSIKP